MLFNSYLFIFVFLPLTLLLFRLTRLVGGLRPAIFVLLLASLVFYAYWNPWLLPLFAGSMLLNYGVGRIIEKASRKRRLWFRLAIFLNLALLGYCKYWNFLLLSLSPLLPLQSFTHTLVLPLAISFYTFQQIAWLADLYRGKIESGSLLTYMAFVSFFPQLIAGPIVRYQDVQVWFGNAGLLRWRASFFATGICLFSLGLFKKVVLADHLALFVAPVFDAGEAGFSPTSMEAWTATLAYTFQLYFDFSGYADMALGLGAMVGVRLPENFASPYRAPSLVAFWRRWHMTLSRFLRDYVYLPLGGGHGSRLIHARNLMMTMLLGGIWHGAGWQFVFWGGMHGLLLVLNHQIRLYSRSWRVPVFAGTVLTFFTVACLWVPFRSPDMTRAFHVYAAMADVAGLGKALRELAFFPGLQAFFRADAVAAPLWLVLSLFIVWTCPRSVSWCCFEREEGLAELSLRSRIFRAFVCGVLFFMSLKTLAGGGSSAFLYFNF